MKTSSTKANSAILGVIGALCLFGGFTIGLHELGQDIDWRDGEYAAAIMLILIGGLTLFFNSSLSLFSGHTEEDLAKPTTGSKQQSGYEGGDGGDGGD